MSIYLLQSMLFQAAFLLCYVWLLKRETFFAYNRLYLLAALVVSFILPFVEITLFQNQFIQEPVQMLLPEVQIGQAATTTTHEAAMALGIKKLLVIVYALGVLVSLILFVQKLKGINALLANGKSDATIVMIPNSSEAFTFLNHIFLGDQIPALSRKHIQHHEEVHLSQKHSYDLLFLEGIKIIFWFNPLVYRYQRELALVHEFIADAASLKLTSKQIYSGALLNQSFGTHSVSFTNSFYHRSYLKNRIVMLHQNTTTQKSLWKYALVLPLLLLMLCISSCENEIQEDVPFEARMEALYSKNETKETISKAEFKEFMKASKVLFGEQSKWSEPEMERFMTMLNTISNKYIGGNNGSYAQLESEAIPFAVIESVPVYPGCDAKTPNAELKKCMSEKVSSFIQQAFNADLGKEVGLVGKNKIFVQFTIDRQGHVVQLKARAPHPSLETEAIRVISQLPQFQPGRQNGQPKAVIYSLPISFEIDE